MYEAYGKDVQFFIVYIAEAHALDSAWPILRGGPLLEEPATLEERISHAGKCVEGLGIARIPALVDGIDDKVMKTYEAWPDRLYLVGKDGKISYKGGKGPFNFSPDELDAEIRKELGLPASIDT